MGKRFFDKLCDFGVWEKSCYGMSGISDLDGWVVN